MVQNVSYAEHRRMALSLASALRKAAEYWEAIGMGGGQDQRPRRLRELAAHLEGESFNVMIAGEFKRGKSTLINAMLGNSVLPARVAPCTAVITEVRYADAPRALLHYVDPAREAVEIPHEDIKKYVVIEDEPQPKALAQTSAIKRVEVLAPVPLCKNGVAIVDSPGLNEHETRTDVAMDYLTKADAMIVVLSCEQALSQSELEFIQQELPQQGKDLRNVFVVWNRWDAIRDEPDEQAAIQARSRSMLEPHVGGASHVFYVSAKDALEGRKKADSGRLAQSNFPAFEQALETYLARERGRLKMRSPLMALEQAVQDADGAVCQREAMLKAPLEALEARYAEQKPHLEALERKRDHILRQVDASRDRLVRKLLTSYQRLMLGIEPELTKAVNTVDVGWGDIAKLAVKKGDLQHRLEGALTSALKGSLATWQQSEVTPTVEEGLQDLEMQLSLQLNEFVSQLQSIRNAIMPDVVTPVVSGDEDVSMTERILCCVGGFVLGGAGAGIMGGALGFKGLVKGIGPHLAAMVLLIILGLNPVALIVASVLSGLGSVFAQSSSIKDDIKQRIVQAFVKELHVNIPQSMADIEKRLDDQFDSIRGAVDEALGVMIGELRGQVEQTIAEKRTKQRSVEAEVARLQSAQKGLRGLLEEVTSIRNLVYS